MSEENGSARKVSISLRLWSQWGAITRFMESARLALAREREFLSADRSINEEEIRLDLPVGAHGIGNYAVSRRRHLEAISSEETLLAAVLVHSYALTEATACEWLQIDSAKAGGIESWGGLVLRSNNYARRPNDPWERVEQGKAGAVEVSLVRHAYAHGTRTIDAAGAARYADAGGIGLVEGSKIELTYADTCEYRARLRSILRVSGFGFPRGEDD